MGPSPDTHKLNARLLRFRSGDQQEDALTLAEDLLAAKRYGDARGVVVSAQSDDGEQHARLLVLEGRAWYLDRDLVRAQAALLNAARIDPRSAAAFRWLGEVLLKRGDPSRAARALQRAVQLGDDSAELARLSERAAQLARHAAEETGPDAPLALQSEAAPPAASVPEPEAIEPPPASRAPTPIELRAPPAPAFAGAASAEVLAPLAATSATPRPRATKPVFAKSVGPAPSPFPPSGGPQPAAPSLQPLGRALLAPPPAVGVPAPKLAPRPPSAPLAQPSYARPIPSSAPDVPSFDDLSEGALDEEHELSSAGVSSSPGSKASPRVPSSAGALMSPKPRSSAGEFSSPGAVAAARPASSPGRVSSPGGFTSPGAHGSPGLSASPTAATSPGRSTLPGALSSPGTASSPRRSSPGGLTSPGAASSPGASTSPGMTSPGASSSPSRVTAAGSTSPGRISTSDAPLSLSAFAGDNKIDTTPGVGSAPLPLRDPSTQWDAPSVAVDWPTQSALSPDDTGEVALASRARPAEAESSIEVDLDALGPTTTPDLQLGEHAGEAEEPEAVLAQLRVQGVFEPPDPRPTEWTATREVEPSGMRLRNAVITAWVAAVLVCGGGYAGWLQWVARRHADAASLVNDARAAAFEGDYRQLVDAERWLRLARDKHPRSPDILPLELFVHEQGLLESGGRELSPLYMALERAEKINRSNGADGQPKVDPASLAVARAVFEVYSGRADADQALAQAIAAVHGEPSSLYVIGRLEQRLGKPEADAHLRTAASAAPDLIAASLAIAEGQHEQGQDADALAGFEAVRKRRPEQLRAQLWVSLLTAGDVEPAQGMTALDALAKPAREGAPVDRVLWALARARLLERRGERPQAGDVMREALAAGASEPQLLSLMAAIARRAGQLGLAQQAASQALALAPKVGAYRALLASILIERHDGDRALSLLAELPSDAPQLLAMRARAALLTREPKAMRDALDALEPQASGVALASLRLRLRAAIEPSPKLLQDASALLRRAPGDPDALRAVGEAALDLREPKPAVNALQSLTALLPSDAEAFQLLGRAQRMAGDAKAAETSLRHALELSAGFPAALSALGSLLLDRGEYAEADKVFQQLVSQDARDGRLGRIDALLGLGRVDDAQAQLAGLPEAVRDSPDVRRSTARVALARKQPGEAITALRPLIDGASKSAPLLALYGDALYQAEQVNPAAGAYDAALEIDPELPEALLGRGEVHLRAERFDEAIGLLEKAKLALDTRLRPPAVRARMLTLLGRAYVLRAHRGDAERARDLLREAVKLDGPPAESFFWLGEALGGRITPESAAAFKRYLELEPEGPYVQRAKRALGPLL